MKQNPVTSFCPVPEEQQPLNEYEALKESCFFHWSTLNNTRYGSTLVSIWIGGWIVAGPIAAASFPPNKLPVQFFLWGTAGAVIFVILTLLRLYLGWRYIRDRLFQSTVFYEESGWYDGQTWQKPPEILTRDRLIVSYQLQPILNRLQWTLGIIVLLIILDIFIGWQLLLY